MLEKVLETCQFVADNANYVKINYHKIDEISNSIDISSNTHWLEKSPFGLLDFDVREIVNFLLFYHSIGFSYWGNPKWSITTEYGELDGAFAMMYILISRLKSNKEFFCPDNLKDLSFTEFKGLLNGSVEIPLLEQRYKNFKSVSNVISEKMNGDFYNFIKETHSDEELFTIIINYFSSVFADETVYREKRVYFYKLAQLLVSDILHIRKLKEKVKVDYTHLVGCADYKIPQVLRAYEILEYNDELSQLIDSKQEILKDSDFEIEIRACMIVAINAINDRMKSSCPIEINDLIWLKGQDKTKLYKPYHLTRTTSY